MKEDTSKSEEDGTNGERQNAQHLLQDSSLAESERGKRVKPEEENGQILVGRNEEGGRKPGGVRSSQIWLAVAFHRFVVRAYPSSGENRRRSTIVEGGGVGTPRRDRSKQAKEKTTEEGQTRVSAKYLDEAGGRSLSEGKRERERERAR